MADEYVYDPRNMEGVPMPGFDPWFPGETWWKVEGYNSKGGSCTLGASASEELAHTLARKVRETGIPGMPGEESRHYEHYVVLEIQRSVWCQTYVHEVKDA